MGRPAVSFKMIDLQRERAHLAEAERDIVDAEIQISFLHLEIGRAESADAPSAGCEKVDTGFRNNPALTYKNRSRL